MIVIAVILLIVNGPGTQDYSDESFETFISRTYASIWAILLMIGMIITGLWMFIFDLHKQKRQYIRFGVLLVARSTAFSINLTTGKALIMAQSRTWFITNIIFKILSGGIYTKAIVVQSTAVSQKTFVPINAVLIVLVNGLTGIIIWEDWKVVSSWLGYVCVFLLMALGCSLLLGDLGLLQESAPETFRGARPTIVMKSERDRLLSNIKNIPQLNMDPQFFINEHEASADSAIGKRHTNFMNRFSAMPATNSPTTTPKSLHRRCVSADSSRRFIDATNDVSSQNIHTEKNRGACPEIKTTQSYPGPPRKSLFRRNRNSQAAWAAIFEHGNAAHQRNDSTRQLIQLHHDIPSNNDRLSAMQQYSRPSFRYTAMGWDSFKRHILEAEYSESQNEFLEDMNSADGISRKLSSEPPFYDHHGTILDNASTNLDNNTDSDDTHDSITRRGLQVLSEVTLDNSDVENGVSDGMRTDNDNLKKEEFR